MRTLVIFLAITLGIYAALPAQIQAQLNKSGISKNEVAVYIKEVGGREIATFNATKTMVPASVMKVLTTYSSVLTLGFDYRWPTQFYTSGTLQNGVLKGDLVVRAFGDPSLGSEDLDDIVNQIRNSGIREIRGNIIIDRSYFKVGNKDTSGFDENLYSPYNAMPDAMMFEERVSTICVAPKENRVSQKNVDYSYKIVNKLQRVNTPCQGRYSWPYVRVYRNEAVPLVLLQGKISSRCGERRICQVLTKPYKSFYYALKDALSRDGVKVHGGLKLAKVPRDANILFVHYSEPLEKIVSKTAKESDNLYARHLMLLLGAKMYGAPATLDKGRSAIINILRSKGVIRNGVVKVDNGCGLSHISKLNAKILGDVLDDAYARYGERWMNTLSIGGVDGTIKARFRGTTADRHSWMKTGTLKRVKNIAGYVRNRAGKLYNVVILVNSNKGNWRAVQFQNEVIKWLAGTTSAPQAQPSRAKQQSDEDEPKYVSHETPQSVAQNGYGIQVGSFMNEPSTSYLARIRQAGFSYVIVRKDIYKVLIGPYRDETSAKNALERVRQRLNKGAFVIRY
ncbi:MAG: D-alanyl-D-alanine carboxypeptidase/D-alanyl-D-alanine-endopeptidase [Campylobacterales bacterium]|nr:D-alanyl-D-alanine carboxypeptidase/D-alanyl-D-alanine-endopeptidase [Campylobacterales bacterium]